MSQTVETQFGTGTIVDREAVRGRVSYRVEGPGFSTWIEASAMPLDFQWMPGPDEVQDNSTTLPYNPAPQSWTNPAEQNIQPGQGIDPRKRTAPADSLSLQEESESYAPGPDPKLFATAGLDPKDVQAKLGPKYVNAFVEHDFSSLQARLEENPELVMAEYRERVAEAVMTDDPDALDQVGRNEYLEASDSQIREAAWKDVRAKAVRLRHSGQVMTRAATPDAIASQVTGDHGTYEVMVFRSNYFTGNSSVDSWSCECPWGKWAFKREHSFVGRLCSHAYATLLELQALGKSKSQNPVYRNQPGIAFDPSQMRNRRSPRRRSSIVAGIQVGDTVMHKDHSDISGVVSEDSYGQYLVGEGANEYWIDHEDAVMVFEGSRTAEIVDLRPVGWDPYSRNLMNKLQDLWEEGARPGKQKERNDEIRGLVDELRDRGFATDGVIASLKEGFIDRPLGYGDLPDYGTSDEYILEHELRHREDVTEPEFEYEAGGDHGTVNDLNDGGRNVTSGLRDADTVLEALESNGWTSERISDSDYFPTFRIVGRLGSEYITSFTFDQKASPGSLIEAQLSTQDPLGWAAEGLGKTSDLNEALSWLSQYKTADYQDDYAYGEPPAYGSGDEFGGDEDPFYVDPMEREDFPEDDIVASFQRNAGYTSSNWHSVNAGDWEVRWDYKDATYPNENPQSEIIVYVDFECEVRIWDSSGHLTEDYVVNIEDSGDPRGEQVRGEVDLKVQQMYEKDSVQAPGQMELWSSRTEEDVVANFQRNAGHLLGDSGGDSGGHDDISAAASAHLRTAGRNFTMAEQQALIDEDDGNPYDRSGLRLDGTHYL